MLFKNREELRNQIKEYKEKLDNLDYKLKLSNDKTWELENELRYAERQSSQADEREKTYQAIITRLYNVLNILKNEKTEKNIKILCQLSILDIINSKVVDIENFKEE